MRNFNKDNMNEKMETITVEPLCQEIYNGCDGGAYNGNRYLAAAISSKGKQALYASLNKEMQFEAPTKEEGGIIVFPTDMDADLLKQRVAASVNGGWTIGHYFSGRYMSPKAGKQYDENSLSVEIAGIPFERLYALAMEICEPFAQESVLLKDHSSGRVLLASI